MLETFCLFFSVHNHNKQINYIGLLEALSTLIFTIQSGALDILPSPPVTQPGVLGVGVLELALIGNILVFILLPTFH